MGVFEYKTIDADLSVIDGTIIADSPRQARDVLRDRGLRIMSIKPRSESARWTMGWRKKSSSEREGITFIRELGTLLQAGIVLHSAIGTLERQHKHGFKIVIQEISDQIASGSSLAEAMGRQPLYFDSLCVSIVQVGESTGELAAALFKLAEFKEKTSKLRNRVATALMYPLIVSVIGIAVTIFLMTYVVPNLLSTLLQSGKELPAVTQLVKSTSDLLINWWWLLLGGLFIIIICVRQVLRSDAGGLAAQRLILRLPLIGELVRKENTSRIAVMMSGLLESGLQFLDALEIAKRTIRNRVFKIALEDYEEAVRAGRDIATSLEASGVFSPLVIQILAVGQNSGQLEQMLQQLADAYDQEVEVATGRLTALLEPLLIVLMAIMVGVIAFATILPILEVSNVL
jgi:general secretion pathway protein F